MIIPTQFNHAIVRTPLDNIGDGLTTQDLGVPDFELAMRQYNAYIETLQACGLEISCLPGDPTYPDGHFVEDAAIIYGNLVVITQPGAPERFGETQAIAEVLKDKHPVYMTGDARLDGGDILFCADRVLIGLGKRTNKAGAEQLRAAIQEYDQSAKVDFVPFDGMLHLKSGLTELAPGVILLSPELHIDYTIDFAEAIVVPHAESYATNVLPINDAILVIDGYPTVNELAATYYRQVYALQMSEFQKMDGSLTCLSLRYFE
ncbi:MAG: arginine deiminase family protein [Chloroflexota bacterium]